jgi:hypothetical protein
MEKLDNVLERFMTHSEQKCRYFYIGQFEFSPEIQEWVDKCHAYKWLIRFRTGQMVNIGNMKRFARRNGITNLQSLMLPQLIMDLAWCKERAKELMVRASWMRQQFLSSLLKDAVEEE